MATAQSAFFQITTDYCTAIKGCPALNFFSKKVHKKLAKRYTHNQRLFA